MSAALNQMGSQLFGLLGKLSVELAVLAVVVLLAGRFLWIKSPAVRRLLWQAVLLKPNHRDHDQLTTDRIQTVDLVP